MVLNFVSSAMALKKQIRPNPVVDISKLGTTPRGVVKKCAVSKQNATWNIRTVSHRIGLYFSYNILAVFTKNVTV